MLLFTRDAPGEYEKGAVPYNDLERDFGAEGPVIAALVEQLGIVQIECWDYSQLIGVMNPKTRRAVFVRKDRYRATMEDVPKLLAHLTKSFDDYDERSPIETVLIT